LRDYGSKRLRIADTGGHGQLAGMLTASTEKGNNIMAMLAQDAADGVTHVSWHEYGNAVWCHACSDPS
jgi:hypothetical protein